jgi:ribosomal protein L19
MNQASSIRKRQQGTVGVESEVGKLLLTPIIEIIWCFDASTVKQDNLSLLRLRKFRK